MSLEPEALPRGGSEPAKSRVTVPAILLIIVGLLNVPWGLYWVYSGIQASRVDPEEIQAQLKKNPAQQKNLQEMEKQGYSFEGIMKGTSTGLIVFGVMNLIVLPLSAAKPRHTLTGDLIQIGIHMFVIGLPTALLVRRLSGANAN